LFMPIYFLRPDIANFTVGVIGLILLAMFLFVPNRLVLTLLAAVAGWVLTLVCIAVNGRGIEVLFGAFFILALPVVTGFFASQQLHIVQRKQYAMFNQANQANRELEQEVERRTLLEQELKRQATTDPLTGLFNRRQYEMLFRRERERCRRQGTSICLAMADLDAFKMLNDGLGHDSGDIALKYVADLFTAQLREGDVVGRFGGEEFIILLPDTDVTEAECVIERLRARLEDTPVMLKGEPRTITATFSVSAVWDGETDILETLRRVDEGLYRGKRAGRNRVVVV
ncbi:MAG: GGDEF domain-containing protein, partial [Pseudomonas sp.]